MFSLRLKELRNKLNISQQKLADALGLKRTTIAGYETKGREPSIEILNKIANYFNVSIDYLTGREELTPDQELAALLSDPDMHVAFQDYSSWTDEDKKELITYLKAKRVMRENKDK